MPKNNIEAVCLQKNSIRLRHYRELPMSFEMTHVLVLSESDTSAFVTRLLVASSDFIGKYRNFILFFPKLFHEILYFIHKLTNYMFVSSKT